MTIPVEVFDQCLQNNPRGQELFTGPMPRGCWSFLRYAGNRMEADDIMQEGFINVFRNLGQLHSPQALDSWIHRVMVNTAINYYIREVKFRTRLVLNMNMKMQPLPPKHCQNYRITRC